MKRIDGHFAAVTRIVLVVVIATIVAAATWYGVSAMQREVGCGTVPSAAIRESCLQRYYQPAP
jgi:hypothetical protein